MNRPLVEMADKVTLPSERATSLELEMATRGCMRRDSAVHVLGRRKVASSKRPSRGGTVLAARRRRHAVELAAEVRRENGSSPRWKAPRSPAANLPRKTRLSTPMGRGKERLAETRFACLFTVRKVLPGAKLHRATAARQAFHNDAHFLGPPILRGCFRPLSS